MDTEICDQVDIYEQVRAAVRQAVSDTLARIATRDDLNTLLLQLMPARQPTMSRASRRLEQPLLRARSS